MRAVRDDPVAAEDSGWQFLCGADGHGDEGIGKVWTIDEILDFEPSLKPHMNMPSGTSLVRASPIDSWTVKGN